MSRLTRAVAIGSSMLPGFWLGCNWLIGLDAPVEDLCAWVGNPDNCYRRLRKGMLENGVDCKPRGTPTPADASEPGRPNGRNNGYFTSSTKLERCVFGDGREVVFTPAVDTLTLTDASLSSALTMTFENSDGTTCGTATYADPFTFSWTIGAPAGGWPDGGSLPLLLGVGTYTQARGASADSLVVVCPRYEAYLFDLGQVRNTFEAADGSRRHICPNVEQLVPQASLAFKPAIAGSSGAVSFTIRWPRVDDDDAYSYPSGTFSQAGAPLEPDVVTQFNCLIPAQQVDCTNSVKDVGETDTNCGGAEVLPGCPARCGEGQTCTNDCDCDPTTVCAGPEAARTCTRFGEGEGAPPRDCTIALLCENGLADGFEADVDCGGLCPRTCDDGAACSFDADCANGYCRDGTCTTATCTDGVKNQGESDVDCGGSACLLCPEGAACGADTDCSNPALPPVTLLCLHGVCTKPDCTNALKDGNETDVDCGGACYGCPLGLACRVNGDCVSNACTNAVCVVATCDDGAANGTETDVDCGSTCPLCDDGRSCVVDADCVSGICRPNKASPTGLTCYPPTCANAMKDGMESDVDCGGNCAPCGDGLACATDDDCFDMTCSGGVCVGGECADMTKNGTETDVDCGGPMCKKCGLGQICFADADCVTLNCNPSKICVQASCSNSKIDGAETDFNCGGGACPKCTTGHSCKVGADCVDGVCTGGFCVAAP